MFKRILVANRGEIALRIIRACRDMGIEVIVAYSRADRDAALSEPGSRRDLYRPRAAATFILERCRDHFGGRSSGCPGQFTPATASWLKNPTFAQMCRDCQIEFIGPSAESMRLLGNKIEARKLARRVKVPPVPGSPGPVADEKEAAAIAEKIGFPVMIKAAAGGGGRGMRPAHNEATLRTNFRNARAEAESAFKDGSLYIEKLVERPRHVEVQLLADTKGNIVHLWERDCSLQRRHQKLIEESPSPHISAKTRQKLCLAAVRLAKAAGYYSAGTCEFLVDRDGQFLFYGDQRPHPGRASSLRVDHRAGSRAVADSHCRRRNGLSYARTTSSRTDRPIECRIKRRVARG